MALVCLGCGEVFRKDSIIIDEDEDYNFCPKASCHGNVAEIDELLIPSILELNKKGYYTKYCCSGHFWSSVKECYIMFDKDVELDIVPNGYKIEKNGNGEVIIRKCFNENIFEQMLENAVDLYKWAKNLDELGD